MRRVLFFTAVMILCCTLLEKQYFAINGCIINHLPESGFAINGTNEFPEDTIREPMIFTSATNCFVSVRLPFQRDMFFLHPDSETGQTAMMSTDLVKKTYNIKSINLVPFNLRI